MSGRTTSTKRGQAKGDVNISVYKRISVVALVILALTGIVCNGLEDAAERYQNENATLKNELAHKQDIIQTKQSEILVLHEAFEKTTANRMKYLGRFTLTFYAKEQFPNSNTALGIKPVIGVTCAVDPSVIPLGQPVYIDGFGVRFAQDTGGSIKGKRIDVFVDTIAEAYQLGVKREVDVWCIL